MEVEKTVQKDWLQQRSVEIIGERGTATTQADLFQGDRAVGSRASWTVLNDPRERLAGFAADRTQPSVLRSTAEGVLRLFGQRMEAIDARAALATPELLSIGLLMIVPEGPDVV